MFLKNFNFFFAHKKLKKPPQKVAYLWQLRGFFFSAARTAQNSPELHFHFLNSFIQPSLVGSLGPPDHAEAMNHTFRIYGRLHFYFTINDVLKVPRQVLKSAKSSYKD